jgi:hypothetical protein
VVSKGATRRDLSTASGLLRQRDVVPSGVVVTGVRSAAAVERAAARAEPATANARRATGRRATAVK